SEANRHWCQLPDRRSAVEERVWRPSPTLGSRVLMHRSILRPWASMLSSTMVTLDRLLGIIEVIAVPVSLLWLAVAWLAPAAKRTQAAVLVLAVGLTVAQPFAIVAVRQNR